MAVSPVSVVASRSESVRFLAYFVCDRDAPLSAPTPFIRVRPTPPVTSIPWTLRPAVANRRVGTPGIAEAMWCIPIVLMPTKNFWYTRVHRSNPVPERGIAFATSEDVSYGQGPAHHASIIDISDPGDPWLLALFPEPVPPPEAPYKDFYTRGGWCGPHNVNHHQYHRDVEKQGDLFYIAHFNAGLRIYDVSNKRLPVEVGYFIPPEPKRRYGPMPQGALVCQTEDVVVDRRGYIYISDKNQGIWILRYDSGDD